MTIEIKHIRPGRSERSNGGGGQTGRCKTMSLMGEMRIGKLSKLRGHRLYATGDGMVWTLKPERSLGQLGLSSIRVCDNATSLLVARLKCDFESELRSEGDAHSGAGTKKVTQSTGRNEQLLATRNRHGASWIRTKRRDVPQIVHRNGQGTDVPDVVVTGIVAIEKVEEFDKGHKGPALLELDRAADAQIGLQVRRATELVESTLHAIDHHAIADRSRQGDGPRGLRLREEGHIESCRGVNSSC